MLSCATMAERFSKSRMGKSFWLNVAGIFRGDTQEQMPIGQNNRWVPGHKPMAKFRVTACGHDVPNHRLRALPPAIAGMSVSGKGSFSSSSNCKSLR